MTKATPQELEALAEYRRLQRERVHISPDSLGKLLDLVEGLHGKFCKIAGTKCWTHNNLEGWQETPSALREYAEMAAKEIDAALSMASATNSDGGVERRHTVYDGEATRLVRDAKAVREAGVAPGPSEATQPEPEAVTADELASIIESRWWAAPPFNASKAVANYILSRFDVRKRP